MSDPVPKDLQAYDRSLARKRMGAGVLFFDPGGQVLLVDPVYKDTWEIPGGTVNADEAPGQAAVREVQEELGLVLPLGPLLVVDWVPPSPQYSADRLMSEGVMMVFDGGILTADQVAAITLQCEELRSYAFVPPDRLHEFLNDRLTRRVRACLRAWDTGSALYLEDGNDPRPA